MFGNNKKARYWDNSRSYIIKQLGLDENATDAEISAALAEAEADDDANPIETPPATTKAEEKPVASVATVSTAAPDAKNTEGSVSLADFNALQTLVKQQGVEIEALKKVPSMQFTDGKKDTPPHASTKKKSYLETPLSKKIANQKSSESEEGKENPFDDDDDDFYKN